MAKEPKAVDPVVAPADAPPAGPAFTVPVAAPAKSGIALVEALLPIEVDGVRHAPGDAAEIRAELVDALVAAGAVALPGAPDAPAE